MLGAAFEIARSGLAAETLRAQVAATNIANASTPEHVPLKVEQLTAEEGGVRVSVQPAGTDHIGHVDLASEVTSLAYAEAAYTANLAVVETVGEMFQALLDAVDNGREASDRNRD